MPFRSKSQRAWMYANKPEMAKRWQAETPSDSSLPEHVVGKVKRAEPGPPPGVSVKDWDRILQRGPGKVKKAVMGESVSAGFPNAAGPEDWDSVGDSPWKQGEPKVSRDKLDEKKEKSGDYDDTVFSGDPMQLMPHLKRIHKMGHVKQAQGDFEFAELGPSSSADLRGPTLWKPPKLKRAAGLDQEYPQVEDGEKGYDAPVTLQNAPGRTKTATIVHIPRESYVAFLDELGRLDALVQSRAGSSMENDR